MNFIQRVLNIIPEEYKKKAFHYFPQNDMISLELISPLAMNIVIGEFPLGNVEICFNYYEPEQCKAFHEEFILFCNKNNIVQKSTKVSKETAMYDKKIDGVEQDA